MAVAYLSFLGSAGGVRSNDRPGPRGIISFLSARILTPEKAAISSTPARVFRPSTALLLDHRRNSTDGRPRSDGAEVTRNTSGRGCERASESPSGGEDHLAVAALRYGISRTTGNCPATAPPASSSGRSLVGDPLDGRPEAALAGWPARVVLIYLARRPRAALKTWIGRSQAAPNR